MPDYLFMWLDEECGVVAETQHIGLETLQNALAAAMRELASGKIDGEPAQVTIEIAREG